MSTPLLESYIEAISQTETDALNLQCAITRIKRELDKLETEYIGAKIQARRLHDEYFNLQRRMGR